MRQIKTLNKKDLGSQSTPALSTGAFLTQKTDRIGEVKKEIEELQTLLHSSTQTSQSTLLLRKRKEMREVDISLDLMKKDYKKRMDECEERRLLFEGKQAKMREQVLKFEKFIQENDAKRLRAETKSKYERQLFADKCKEMSTLKMKIDEMEQTRVELVIELEVKRRYRSYLLQTIDVGEGYEEVPELLSRYYTLRDATEELLALNNEQENETEEFRVKLQALKTEMQNKSLVGNSVIHKYQKILEDKREFSQSEETEKFHLEDKRKDISRDYSQVAQAIKNLYTRCLATARTKTSMVNQNHATGTIAQNLEDELDVMHYRLSDLIEITDEFRTYNDNAADDMSMSSNSVQGTRSTVNL